MSVKGLRFNKRSVVVTWLISYFSILLIPVVVSGIVYAATWHVVKSEVNRANESVLRQLEQAIDGNLRGMERLSVEVALNKRISGFQNATKPFTDSSYYDLVGIASDLRVYKVANEYIEQIYVYYKNSDTVISTREHIDGKGLHAVLRGRADMSYAEWISFFDKRYQQEYAPVLLWDNGQSEKAVLYAKSVVLDTADQPGAVILFVIKDSKLLENIVPTNSSTVAMIDKANRLVASNGLEELPEYLSYDRLSQRNGLYYGQAAGKTYAVSYTSSENNDWKYVSIMPAERFDENMKNMKKLIYASVGLSLLVGGVVAALFLKKNYSPISLLIRSIQMKAGVSFSEGSNEYMFLQETLTTSLAEKEQIGLRLRQHRDAIRSHFLQGLLKGRLDRSVPVHEALAAHEIRFELPGFAVLSFHIENFGKLEGEGGFVEPSRVKLLHFIMMNVMEEAAGDERRAAATVMDDLPVCIVNVAEGQEGEPERMAARVKAFLLDHFHVNLTVAISRIFPDVYGIPQAYQETLEAMEYRLVMGSGEVIRFDDLPKTDPASTSGGYYYPLHVEQQLINYVKTGDYAHARDVVEEIIEANVARDSLTLPLAKCLMFDLISSLIKTMDEMGMNGRRKTIDQSGAIEWLTDSGTIKDMRHRFGEVLKSVCETIAEERSQEDHSLSRQVSEYVNEHFSEENLNISAIGETFGLTPSYLSRQFRTQTGEALLDYINKTRMEAAKKLLAEQSLPIAEIARKVGYADINTFNRIFKKLEGITPGKYRDIR